MAIMDAKLEIDDGATLTAISGATQAGTNVIALDEATATMKDAWGTAISPDPGEGNNGLVLNFQVGTAFSTSGSLVAKIYHHTASAVASGSILGEVTFGSGSAANDLGTAGAKKSYRLPAGTINRYVGVVYSMITGASGAGTMDCWLGLDTQTPST
jgi:hypothetical protein